MIAVTPMTEFDPHGLVIGIVIIAYVMFAVGVGGGYWIRGRPLFDHNNQRFNAQLAALTYQNNVAARDQREHWVRVSRQIHLFEDKMENLMSSATRALMAAVVAAETKLDAYTAIINANTEAINNARQALDDMKNEPTTDDINAVIDDLSAHLGNVDTAIDHLAKAAAPVSPPPGEPTPVPAPANNSVPA